MNQSAEAQLAALQRQVDEMGDILRALVDNVNAIHNAPKEPGTAPAVEGDDAPARKRKGG